MLHSTKLPNSFEKIFWFKRYGQKISTNLVGGMVAVVKNVNLEYFFKPFPKTFFKAIAEEILEAISKDNLKDIPKAIREVILRGHSQNYSQRNS